MSTASLVDVQAAASGSASASAGNGEEAQQRSSKAVAAVSEVITCYVDGLCAAKYNVRCCEVAVALPLLTRPAS